jgi:hypothetical protein
MNKRIAMILSISALVAVSFPGVADAANNGKRPKEGGCPPSVIGPDRVTNYVLSDAAEWLAATVAGYASEGITMEQAASWFGLTVPQFELEIFEAIFGLGGVDHNGDGFVCRGSVNPGGIPNWLFLTADNKFNDKFVK